VSPTERSLRHPRDGGWTVAKVEYWLAPAHRRVDVWRFGGSPRLQAGEPKWWTLRELNLTLRGLTKEQLRTREESQNNMTRGAG